MSGKSMSVEFSEEKLWYGKRQLSLCISNFLRDQFVWRRMRVYSVPDREKSRFFLDKEYRLLDIARKISSKSKEFYESYRW